MFGFLKDKLKKIIPGLSKKIEEEAKPEEKKIEIKPGEVPKIEELAARRENKKIIEEKAEKEVKEILKKPEEEKKKTFFGKIKEELKKKKESILSIILSESKFNDIFWDLELILLENNVAVEIIEKIKQDLKEKLVEQKISRSKIEKIIKETLQNTISSLFETEKFDFIEKVKSKKPFVISFVGINGSGKTTTLAKVASLLMDDNLKVVLAAADTFRAAAIDQLQEHADNLNIKLIKHSYGADAAAVAFDAVAYAKAHSIDVVLIDTAGRLHSNINLMDELKKIHRIAKPDLTIFIGESITGNDCVEQAKKFNEIVGIDGIILSKADVDEKGGAAISISYVTKKPILYLGTGQEYGDLIPFDANIILSSLGLEGKLNESSASGEEE